MLKPIVVFESNRN